MRRFRLGRIFVAVISSAITLALALIPPSLAWADQSAWEVAKRPGAVLLMRHALAPGTGDPANFTLDDCSTQRNLSDVGRDQARRVGEALRRRGIAVQPVLTSQWCRCRETAELLGLGQVADFAPLNSFFENRSAADRQTRETLNHLAALPDDRRPMLVTHQVNITAIAGVVPRSGEVVVVDVDGDGQVALLGRILVDP